jgi:hypothetical protein
LKTASRIAAGPQNTGVEGNTIASTGPQDNPAQKDETAKVK